MYEDHENPEQTLVFRQQVENIRGRRPIPYRPMHMCLGRRPHCPSASSHSTFLLPGGRRPPTQLIRPGSVASGGSQRNDPRMAGRFVRTATALLLNSVDRPRLGAILWTNCPNRSWPSGPGPTGWTIGIALRIRRLGVRVPPSAPRAVDPIGWTAERRRAGPSRRTRQWQLAASIRLRPASRA